MEGCGGAWCDLGVERQLGRREDKVWRCVCGEVRVSKEVFSANDDMAWVWLRNVGFA